MRRARIQIKPNISKAAKQEPPPEPAPVVEETLPQAPVVAEPRILENVETMTNQVSLTVASESMKSLHVDTSKNHHVHFTDDVIDNEQNRIQETPDIVMISPTSQQNAQFASPNPPARLTPRSRNVSMCEDEAILQPKQPRDKKRFSGREELDTKTWKMSDLTRWNPKNEMTRFKRERRSSTSSSVITKSEIGDLDAPPAPRINAPQVKIGADGRLVIDETSLVVHSAQINHESVWETVEEGRMGAKITSMSFRKRGFGKSSFWSEKETDLFYEVLQCTGQDFGLMSHYLPKRTRPELKAKYNREEKINWARVLNAISHPVRLDGNLEVRISKLMTEMEEEAQEKKAKGEYEKAEEKRIREQNRLQKATERNQAKELVKQAKELERDARNAAKLNMKADKEARAQEKSETRQLEKTALKEARLMATEAKRIAMEARAIIKESRKLEKSKKADSVQSDSHNLEREAERIIRRLLQESQREDRRTAHFNKNDKPAAPKSTEEATTSEVSAPTKSPAPVVVTIDASEGELGDTSTDAADSSSASSSDDDALRKDAARREKQRMKEARRNLKPRKTVADKKPVYVDTTDPKYAQQKVSRAVEMVLKANGNMFDSAGEQDDDFPDPDEMETSAEPVVVEEVAPDPTPPPPENMEENVVEESVPQSVIDVVEEIMRGRSKTPVETAVKPLENTEESKTDGEDRKKRSADVDSGGPSPKVARLEGVDVPVEDSTEVATSSTVTSSSAPSSSSSTTVAPAIKPSTAPKPAIASARRTVKKPNTWSKKK